VTDVLLLSPQCILSFRFSTHERSWSCHLDLVFWRSWGGDVAGSSFASCEAAGFASYPIAAHCQQEMELRGGRSGWIAERSSSEPLPEEMLEPCWSDRGGSLLLLQETAAYGRRLTCAIYGSEWDALRYFWKLLSTVQGLEMEGAAPMNRWNSN
jgi:hypothetical protein